MLKASTGKFVGNNPRVIQQKSGKPADPKTDGHDNSQIVNPCSKKPGRYKLETHPPREIQYPKRLVFVHLKH